MLLLLTIHLVGSSLSVLSAASGNLGLFLTLVGYCFLELLDFFGIAEEVVLHEVEVIVELKYVRKSSGEVEADDVLVADALEVLDHTAEAITMSNYEEVVYLLESGEDNRSPVGERATDAVLQRLCAGEFSISYFSVASLIFGVAFFVVFSDSIGSDVKATTPYEHLLLTILSSSLALVETLEHAVVLFVQAPALLYGDPILVHGVEHVVEGLDGALEVGSVSHTEFEAFLLEEFASLASFTHTFFGEVYVGPTRETVFEVPLAFAMTEEYDSFHKSKYDVFMRLLLSDVSALLRDGGVCGAFAQG